MTEVEKEQLTCMNIFFVGSIFLLDYLNLLKRQLSCGKHSPLPKNRLLRLVLRDSLVLHVKSFITEVPNSVVVLHYFVPT